MEIIEVIALIIISLSIVKITVMLFSKNIFNSFIKAYKNSISNNKWIYFSVYFLLSIFILYLVKTNTDITYTQIIVVATFISFMINAVFMAIPSFYEHFDISKMNHIMVGLYMSVWIFLIYKTLKELFKF